MPSVVALKRIVEDEGILCPIEFQDLPFKPQRIFYVFNVPRGETRGKHAHYNTQQMLVCLKGIIEVHLFDGIDTYNKVLFPSEYIFVDKLVWDSQTYLTGEELMISVCSTPYNPDDYIHDLEEFKRVVHTLDRNGKRDEETNT